MIGLSQWSFDLHHSLLMGNDQLEAPLGDETSPERTSESKYSDDAQTEPIIWGDSPHAQHGHPQAAQSQVDPQ
jgi:hypothetical protein